MAAVLLFMAAMLLFVMDAMMLCTDGAMLFTDEMMLFMVTDAVVPAVIMVAHPCAHDGFAVRCLATLYGLFFTAASVWCYQERGARMRRMVRSPPIPYAITTRCPVLTEHRVVPARLLRDVRYGPAVHTSLSLYALATRGPVLT
eukprot:2203513-Rhodomonas_salina.1